MNILTEHLNFGCAVSDDGPMIVSFVRDGDSYTCLFRDAHGNRRITVPSSDISVPFFRRLFGLGAPVSSYIKAVAPNLQGRRFKKISNPDLPTALLDFEEKQTIKGFKFGVIYCAPGQVREDELFTNG